MTGKVTIVVLGMGLIFGCASTPHTTQPADSMDSRAEIASDHVRDAYRDDGPGVAYLISHKGRVLAAGGDGYADLEWNGKMAADTAIRIGSISKPITAVIVLQLAEQGLIDLDRPVGVYAPDLPEHFGAVTMRQLLSHRSGLADLLSDPALLEHVWLPISTDKLIDLATDAPISFAPGAKYEYVNFNYILVANVIEKITQRSYIDLVNTFFAEHGMTNSHFDVHSDIIANRASAYELKGDIVAKTPGLDLSHTSAAGALLSSAADLNHWIGLLASGALIEQSSIDMAWTPQPLADNTPTSYGLGFNVREFCGVRAIWHTGLAPGGQGAFMFAPDEGLFAVVLSNAYNTPNTGKLSREMMAEMLTGRIDAPCISE